MESGKNDGKEKKGNTDGGGRRTYTAGSTRAYVGASFAERIFSSDLPP